MTIQPKPYETPIINIPFGHPHTKGLVAHYLFNGTSLLINDYTQNQNDLSININNGISWTLRTSADNISWRSVCYGNGLFVAVAITGTGNRVMTSPDGITWTPRTSAADNNWHSVCYGNGLFVAVSYTGTGNRVMTSPDGITWTPQTSAANNGWLSVTYGNGLFVAVSYTGTGNRVMTSPDGITWTPQTSAADNSWYSVCYGNGLFVAVAITGTGNRVMTSPDGITWTPQTSAADNDWSSICYGNGLFVAVSYTGTGNRVMTSPDGITWTPRTSAADNNWHSVCYGNGLFVAVSYTGTGNRVMTSPDGITWTSRTSAADNDWLSVTSGNRLFVAVSNTGTGNRVMTSGTKNIYVPNGICFNGNGQYASLNNSKQIINSNIGTIILKFKSLSAFNDSTTRCLFGSYGGSYAEGNFLIAKLSDNYLYFVVVDSVGEHWVRITEPTGWTTGVQISVLWNRSKAIWNSDNLVININGVHTTPESSNAETSWNSFTVDTSLYVGNDASNSGNECNGIIEYLSIRDSVLIESLLKNINDNPHDMFGYITIK